MKFLITGVAGFIGSNLAKHLKVKYPDCEIHGCDNFTYGGHWSNIPTYVTMKEKDCVYDIDYDWIFHLASSTDTTETDIEKMMKNNVYYWMPLFGLQNVTVASSASIYGNPKEQVPFKVTDSLDPLNAYAFTKVQLEHALNSAQARFRFFNVYGPGEEYKGKMASMITQIVKKAKNGETIKLITDGNQRRDFIHVDDVCKVLIRSINNEYITCNLGTGYAISFNEIIDIVRAKYPNLIVDWINCPYSFFQKYTCADMGNYIKSKLCDETHQFLGRENSLRKITEYINSY